MDNALIATGTLRGSISPRHSKRSRLFQTLVDA